eukprot:COSAG03_NODE_16301_length_406_cov_0.524430_1_plen_27_part_10
MSRRPLVALRVGGAPAPMTAAQPLALT